MSQVFQMPKRPHGWRAPEFATARDCLRAALPTIAPIRRQKVSAWAEAERYLNDNGSVVAWRNSVAPYMVEPMDTTDSRRFRAAVFVGPARTAKSEALILNKVGHKICCDPCDIRIVQMDQNAAREFSQKKLDGLVRACPTIRARLGRGRHDDNIFDKRFEGEMTVDVAWPVISKMSSSDIPLMLLTDYDRMPEDIGGEGPPFDLSLKRTQTFGSRGMTVAESSPGRIVLDRDFEAPEGEPHLAPPCTGILALYNRGTRGRFYWSCPDCAGKFEPNSRCLQYPETGTPLERGAAAYMACPHCGCVIEARHKRELNGKAEWLHESRNAGELVPIHDADLRETEIASWWLKGAAAAFQSWAELVARYETALEELARTGDDKALKTTINVDQGEPYSPRSTASEDELTVKELKDRSSRFPMNVAPVETRFLTVQVDVQKRHFVAHIHAWGEGLEHWLIARKELTRPPETAPRAEERAIDPARYPEDWDVLFNLLELEIPVAETAFSLQPVALIVDSGGADGVTKNAYAFYRRAKKQGYGNRVYLAKGMRRWDRDRAVLRAPEKIEGQRRKAGAVPTDLRIVQVGTWRLKSEIAAALTRDDPGPGAFHVSKDAPQEVFEELCSEEKTARGWELRPGKKRNEALDLSVYGLALVTIMKADRIDWTRPPAWAAVLSKNSFASARKAECEAERPVIATNPEPESATSKTNKPKRIRPGLRRVR